MGSLLVDGGISRYFRRRKYRRLHCDRSHVGGGSDCHGRSGPPTRRRRRRSWRIRIVPKIVVRAIWSPSVKLLARLRNAYLNAMINVAGKNGAWSTGNAFGGKRITRASETSPVMYPFNEVENRIILEIFKALKAHQP